MMDAARKSKPWPRRYRYSAFEKRDQTSSKTHKTHGGEVYVMRPDGAGQTLLTNNSSSKSVYPAWGGQGKA